MGACSVAHQVLLQSAGYVALTRLLINYYLNVIGGQGMELTPEDSAPRPEVGDDDGYWRISKKKVKRRLGWLTRAIYLALFLLLVVVFFMPSSYGDMSKAYFAEFIARLRGEKVSEVISEQLKANPRAEIEASTAELISSKTSMTVEGVPVQISYKAVARDGTITVFSPQLGALLVLRPRVETGEVKWSCFGSSVLGDRAVPHVCREPLSDNKHPAE
jgi:hypothetical protein